MLLSLATLKARLPITNSADDTPLTNLINQMASRFELYCDRFLERAAGQTEYHNSKCAISLKRFPVETLSLYFDTERDFGAGTILTANQDYVLNEISGLVELTFNPSPYPLAIKAVITGGYVGEGTSPSAGQTAVPAAISRAMLQQCEFEWKNHHEFGRQTISMQGQSVSVADFDLLPDVKQTLNAFKRISL